MSTVTKLTIVALCITINLYYADNPLDKTRTLAEKAFAKL